MAFALVLAAVLLVGCGPSDPIQAVRQQLNAGDVEGGLESLRELLAEDSENPELLFLYGQVLNATGQPGLAEWPLRKAMQDPVWFETAAKLLASVEQSGGNFENAANLYAEILEVNPDDLDARIRRANACARTPALFNEALAEVDRILEIDPDAIGVYKPRILALMGLNKPEEAGQALEELGERIAAEQDDANPIFGWHCATMAIFASDSGDEDLAAKRWAECEEKYPTHANVVVQSVEFHKRRGEYERALEVAERAFAASPEDDSGYRIIVVDLLRQLGRPEEAEALLVEAVESTDDVIRQSAALLALTEHYKLVGDLDSAAATLERALALTQSSIGPQPDLLFSLADLLIQTGEFDRALELSGQMTVAAHRSLVRARVAHERKQYPLALKLYEDTTRLWPENPYAPYHEARAAKSAGLFDRAFQSYLLSIRVDEAATDARVQAARLMAAEGHLTSALEMLGTGRVAQSPEAELLVIEIGAQVRGPQAGTNAANRMSNHRPAYFGQAIAAAARGASRRANPRDAWRILSPLLSLEFPPVNQFPILRAAVLYAPGDEELAVVGPLVEKAVAAHPEAAEMRETEGILRERRGDPEAAAESYRKALAAEPERVSAMLRLARLTAAEDPGAATELLQKALAAQATSVERFDADLFAAAVEPLPSSPEHTALLESGLELDPTSGEIAYRLALELEGDADQADRVASLAARAIRFQVGEGAVALRDRVKTQG